MPKKVVDTKVVKPKKTTAKSTTKKVTSLKTLVYANNSKSFWLNNGQVLNSLLALKEAFAEMEKSVFAYHVTKEKNDFADWVEKVLDDADCALDLKKSKTPLSAYKAVVKRLKNYQI